MISIYITSTSNLWLNRALKNFDTKASRALIVEKINYLINPCPMEIVTCQPVFSFPWPPGPPQWGRDLRHLHHRVLYLRLPHHHLLPPSPCSSSCDEIITANGSVFCSSWLKIAPTPLFFRLKDVTHLPWTETLQRKGKHLNHDSNDLTWNEMPFHREQKYLKQEYKTEMLEHWIRGFLVITVKA